MKRSLALLVAVLLATLTASAAAEAGDGRMRAYRDVLLLYRQAQDGGYTMEQVEDMGLYTELVQHGWPTAALNDEVRYLYFDADSDGSDELVITYCGDIVDLYDYDGQRARHVFSTPYRGITKLHPGGMLSMTFSISASDYSAAWYQYDPAYVDWFAVFEHRYQASTGDAWYIFCYYGLSDEERAEVDAALRDTGYYPVWLGEWADMITEEEYDQIVPKTAPLRLPEGERLSDLALSDGDFVDPAPFYGVWLAAFAQKVDADALVSKLAESGVEASYIYTPDWENMNPDPWFCVTMGRCATQDEAKALLPAARRAGFSDAYVKHTGRRTGHRLYFYRYGAEALTEEAGQVTLHDVPVEDLSGGLDGRLTLVVDEDTQFDPSCDTAFFGNYRAGDTPLDWLKYNMELMQSDPDLYAASGPALLGVFEVSVTGSHIDRFYGSCWWD